MSCGNDGLLLNRYVAYAVEINDASIRVHFEGWPREFDEEISENAFSSRIRLLTTDGVYGPKGKENVSEEAVLCLNRPGGYSQTKEGVFKRK